MKIFQNYGINICGLQGFSLQTTISLFLAELFAVFRLQRWYLVFRYLGSAYLKVAKTAWESKMVDRVLLLPEYLNISLPLSHAVVFFNDTFYLFRDEPFEGMLEGLPFKVRSVPSEYAFRDGVGIINNYVYFSFRPFYNGIVHVDEAWSREYRVSRYLGLLQIFYDDRFLYFDPNMIYIRTNERSQKGYPRYYLYNPASDTINKSFYITLAGRVVCQVKDGFYVYVDSLPGLRLYDYFGNVIRDIKMRLFDIGYFSNSRLIGNHLCLQVEDHGNNSILLLVLNYEKFISLLSNWERRDCLTIKSLYEFDVIELHTAIEFPGVLTGIFLPNIGALLTPCVSSKYPVSGSLTDSDVYFFSILYDSVEDFPGYIDFATESFPLYGNGIIIRGFPMFNLKCSTSSYPQSIPWTLAHSIHVGDIDEN